MRKKTKTLNKIISIIFFVIAFLLLFVVFNKAVSKTEINQCERFKEMSESISIFYMTQAEDEMCKHYGFDIDARIKP